jgi:hypothetical protein
MSPAELENAVRRGTAEVRWDGGSPRRKPHRLDGPAVIWRSGQTEWYIHGIRVHDFNDYQGLTECSSERTSFLKLKWGEIPQYWWS